MVKQQQKMRNSVLGAFKVSLPRRIKAAGTQEEGRTRGSGTGTGRQKQEAAGFSRKCPLTCCRAVATWRGAGDLVIVREAVGIGGTHLPRTA